MVSLGCACQDDLTTPFTQRLRLAVHQPIHQALVKHCAAVAIVPRLRAALALAGPVHDGGLEASP